MGFRSRIAVVVAVSTVAWIGPWCCAPAAHAEQGAAVSFPQHIAPLLVRHCVECHGPEAPKGELNLAQRSTALAGGKSGKALVPGQLDDSLLWAYVEADTMPPRSRPRLSAEQKQHLRRWIEAGAPWPEEMADLARLVPSRQGGSAWVRRLSVPEYIQTVQRALGVNIEHEALRMLPPDQRADGFSNTAYNLHVDLAHVEAYARLAEIIAGRIDAAALAARFTAGRPVAQAELRPLIAELGKRLLRGPLAEHELAAYLRVAQAVEQAGGDPLEAVRYVVEAMLQSPRFLYRMEQSPDGYALASRLSYIVWGAPPDEELLRAAESGALSDRRHVEAQVRRMLADPLAVVQSQRFIEQWLDLGRLDALRPDPKRFPRWDPQLAADMRDETLAFFTEVAWKQNRPLADLLNAQVTFLSPRLAEHYKLSPQLAQEIASEPAARLVGRATRGLQALYTFQESGGDTIRDVSGAGEPLDLKIQTPRSVQWRAGQLVINDSALIVANAPTTRLLEAVKASGELTLEAWITPADARQTGPARIVTFSAGPNQRNFTLGQDGDRFDVRLRSTKTDPNGMPSLGGPTGRMGRRPIHVAYTRDASGKARLYLDGVEEAARDVSGELTNWDGAFRLAVANETTGDRPWKGVLHLLAIYSRALSAEEVRGNARGLARYDLTSVPSRGGLLTQGSVLTIGGDDGSPVARGLFVLRELLYSNVDDPPPCVDVTPVPPKPGLSQRAIVMQRINNQACSACHRRFETIALGLEKFDGLGVHRDRDEHGNVLRDDGEIHFPDHETPTKFQSSAELMDLLAASPRVHRALTRKVTQFALGRPLGAADEAALEHIHAEAQRGGGTYAALITAIVLSDLVQRVEHDAPRP
jgi:mono/diheme cytochrome c family protein